MPDCNWAIAKIYPTESQRQVCWKSKSEWYNRKGGKGINIIFETHINEYGENQNIGEVLRQLADYGYLVELVASSSERGTKILKDFGSIPQKRIRTDEVYRTIHKDLAMEQLIHCLEVTGGIRTVFLGHNDAKNVVIS